MSVVAVVAAVAARAVDLVVRLEDKTPKDEDVKAGWTALVLFLLLVAAVVLLAFSLVKQLRKAQAAEDAGVYGHDDNGQADPANGSASSESEPRSTG